MGEKRNYRKPAQPIPDQMVGLSDAAQFLGYHPDTVRKWVRDGRLPAYRVGPNSDLRFKMSDLQSLLQPVQDAR